MTTKVIPGPKPRKLLGSLQAFQGDQLGFLRDCVERFGDVFQFRVGPLRFVVVNDLALVSKLLVEDADRYTKSKLTREIFGRIMGNGLMVSEGDYHRRQRRLAQPAFDAERLRSYTEIAVRHARAVSDRWADGQEIDVEDEMSRVTMGVAAEVMYGADISPGVERLTSSMKELQAAAVALFNSGFLSPAWLPTPKNRALRRAVAGVDSVLDKVIEERRKDPVDRGDLLSRLLFPPSDAGQPMSLAQVRDETRTIFLSGFETTANALTWTWYHLAREKDARTTLEQRLAEASSAVDVPQYVTMLVKESLRVSSPIWAFNRTPIRREELGGYTLVPGDIVIVSPYLLHRDARHYRNPESFEPERFSDQREREIPRFAFLPFGAGPRICIGSRLALLELSAVVSTIARRFRLTLPEGYVAEPKAFVSVRPKGGLKMTVVKRRDAATSN